MSHTEQNIDVLDEFCFFLSVTGLRSFSLRFSGLSDSES